MENIMEETFPKTLFISQAGSGDDAYLSACKTEEQAIKATDDETTAYIAEYQLIAVSRRKLITTVGYAD